MEIILYLICIILFFQITIIVFKINKLKNIEYKKPEILSDKKILTVYYSNSGNTKNVAENLHSIVGGDLKEIQLIKKYPNHILKMTQIVRKQIKNRDLPKIKDIDTSYYDVIFVASPIWNFSISLPLKSFLKNTNFKSKIVIPLFTYSGGACKNKIFKEFKCLTNAKETKKPLSLFENGIILTKQQIINWLNNL